MMRILLVSLLSLAAMSEPAAAADPEQLTILTPHNTQIQAEFEAGFKKAEARLHKEDEEGSDQHPDGVDGADHGVPVLRQGRARGEQEQGGDDDDVAQAP